jgi:hypothetical protein
VTATAVEPAATPEPTITGPDEVLLVPLPGEVEERIRRFVRQAQAPLGDVVASWLAAGDQDAPVPAEVAGAVNVLLPGEIIASVRAEAACRGLTPGQVAAARLASVAGRG